MPYPQHIEQKLEFDIIRQKLNELCLSPMGMHYVSAMKFTTRFDTVQMMLNQTAEFKQLLQLDQPFPSEHYHPIDLFLKKASLEGMFLLEHELYQLLQMLRTFGKICNYFEQRTEHYPALFQLFGGISVNQHIIKNIEKIIDEDGNIRPNASPELAKLSAQIGDKEREIRKRINRLYEKYSELDYLGDTGITVRDGRLVLPVLADHKRHVGGFVHDESATGQTVYIEPAEIFDLNNILRELQIAYRRERERILTELTNRIRPDIPELSKYAQKMGIADFIRAKALLAIAFDAHIPLLHKLPIVKLKQAYHPLLKLHLDKNKLHTEALYVSIAHENRILVISGPNAGGKSICLKTIGLLQYMMQCGLAVPCSADSEMCVFKELMVDIGDEQSIENDLSTYSSHLRHMKYFTDFADTKTLFLIDEFGTGTDPQFGGPLAEAILDKLMRKGAYGVVTTHYTNLKTYASNTRFVQNASMLFDNANLIPLYKLEQGKPGSSYAFEIAQKTGLPADVLLYAKSKIGDKQKRVDDLLIELEREKKHVNELRERFEKKDKEANDTHERYQKLQQELESRKKQYILDAKAEALSIISEANSKIEQAIREIKEKKGETETMRKVRAEIKQETEKLKEETAQPKQTLNAPKQPANDIVLGMQVKIAGQTEAGEVIELKKGKAHVAFGFINTWVEVDKLVPEIAALNKVKPVSQVSMNVNTKLQNFQTELNLIGIRGEDAIKQLQLYMDDAYLLGFKQVRIVHGKGYGILRKLVREWLRKSGMVETIADEHIEMGGDGVSIVTLKL
jgi:DNA mismatch repair protein MutS2